MVSEQELKEYCLLLRTENISIDDFRAWVVKSGIELKGDVTRGDFLKLKNGSVTQVLKILSKLVTSCDRCAGVYNQKVFSSRSEFENCLSAIEKACSQGVFNSISKPSWFDTLDKVKFGVEDYYMCDNCHSQWCIVFPEKEFNGEWERIS
ncbi:hypothetical protein [Gallaecimonas pentaromativorans]|uniref:hypothetical protein n=1 Tax=Gallaecimonas pentaromativorans TaxID=584787 RepID=UPI0012ECE590|nr:hypothetical protein [Gallaecimonas pentaromativorans]